MKFKVYHIETWIPNKYTKYLNQLVFPNYPPSPAPPSGQPTLTPTCRRVKAGIMSPPQRKAVRMSTVSTPRDGTRRAPVVNVQRTLRVGNDGSPPYAMPYTPDVRSQSVWETDTRPASARAAPQTTPCVTRQSSYSWQSVPRVGRSVGRAVTVAALRGCVGHISPPRCLGDHSSALPPLASKPLSALARWQCGQ